MRTPWAGGKGSVFFPPVDRNFNQFVFAAICRYMKYLYPYECEKLHLSAPDELQSAIDGNRREGRRSGHHYSSPPPEGFSTNTMVVAPPVAIPAIKAEHQPSLNGSTNGHSAINYHKKRHHYPGMHWLYRMEKNKEKPHQTPLKTIKNPQTPSKSHQNPIEAYQNPSNPIKPH